MAQAQVQLRLRTVDTADLDAAYGLADERPEVDLEASAGEPGGGIEGQVEPITAVLVGAGVVAAAKFVLDWWDKRRGGLVIDQRPAARDQLYRDADVPYGVVVVFAAKGGQVKVQTHDMPKDGMQQLLEAVVSGAYKSVADLAKLAKDTLPQAQVEQQPDIRSA
ncbi:hypothetical protein [Pseudorhodoferax sp. Leaf274]|uniref:hypothetical protein n=1 Tax=Pseudorhodoferax sp. Leaf274 TaxID=1736318 RepID=UPI00070382A3|nr:hypothetical protein [Pseudorhodoferax sp. Leaf274]KQP49565.1 hypothetical protein ASF44_02935 [Pseudorhodoferax sp. Leaf274]